MDLKGKTIVFLGSSVTFGSAADGYSMCEYIEEMSGCTACKWAVSGTTLADTNEMSYVSRLKKHIETQKQCDIFICQLSTNDAGQDIPIGEISSFEDIKGFDINTIAGAIEYIIARVKDKWNCPVVFYTGTYFDSPKYAEMVKLLLKLQKKWDFNILNLWDDEQMGSINKNLYEKYMNDPVHPTKSGYVEWWGPKFLEYINKML